MDLPCLLFFGTSIVFFKLAGKKHCWKNCWTASKTTSFMMFQ